MICPGFVALLPGQMHTKSIVTTLYMRIYRGKQGMTSMSELTKDNDDAALDWLFTKVRKYPLLTAQDEQAIDLKKWQALEQAQRLFVADEYCRRYLGAWADNILHNPPTLERCEIREHYYLLRREQAGLLEGGEQRPALVKFSKCISGPARKQRDEKAISALQLPAGLVAGLVETLVAASTPCGVAQALHDWHDLWPALPKSKKVHPDPATVAALRQWLATYYAAREQLVNHNLRLVFSIAGHLAGRGVPYRDLIQNGVVGLIRAAEKFEQRKGYRFSTYAYNWISQAVRNAIEDQRGIVRYPSGVNEQISRMHRARLHHINTTGKGPNVQTLAQRLKMKPEALLQLQQVGNLSISLDAQPNGEMDGLAPGETLAGGPFASTAGVAEQASLNRHLMHSIKILEPSEQRVVIQRWGLDKGVPRTRAEIAVQMDVSTEWVRQLEVSALAKLRNDAGMVEAYQDYQGVDG
jgi:RNA polymerase sigma factor (sigma-70 family)